MRRRIGPVRRGVVLALGSWIAAAMLILDPMFVDSPGVRLWLAVLTGIAGIMILVVTLLPRGDDGEGEIRGRR